MHVLPASENQGIILAATEAIRVVLMEMAFQYNFRGNVIIYTDNMCAKDKWYHSESRLYLATLFLKSIFIPYVHIPLQNYSTLSKS